MASVTFFLSPGLRDVEDARRRYRAEEREAELLDAARLRSIADALVREHGMVVSDEETDGEQGGRLTRVDLEADQKGSVEMSVDGGGALLWIHPQNSPDADRAALKRGLAVARTAARLLASAVYDVDRDRLVEPDDPEVLTAGAEELARPEPRAETPGGSMLLIGIALVAVTVLRLFLHGIWLFVALVAVVLGASALLSLRKRSSRAATARVESATMPKPIKPS